MVANARAIHDPAFRVFVPVAPLGPQFAGSVDYVLSFAWMLRATVLVGVVCLVAELVQRPVWLLRLWHTLVIAGVSIAMLGLLQKATGAQMIFWRSAPPWEVKTFFATFFYHANAGAFLNLVLPVTAGLAVWTLARCAGPLARAVWASAFLIVVIAVLSNTSRMGQAVGFLTIAAIVTAVIRPASRVIVRTEKHTLIVGVVVVAITAFAIAQASHLDRPLGRWQQFMKQLPVDQRWAANRAAITAVDDAGLFGFGPGVFRAVFPHYQQVFADRLHGTWRFLHNDYLQTLLEWGWVGSALIAALFFGSIAVAIRSYRNTESWSTRQRILLPCVVLALIGVALHAMVDFPLQILSIQLLVASFLGICWGSLRWSEGRR